MAAKKPKESLSFLGRLDDPDEKFLVTALKNLRDEINGAYQRLDYLTNSELIDSCIYEIKALNMKYEYYLRQYKGRGLTAKVAAGKDEQ